MDISISIDACSEYMYPPNIRKAQMVSKDSPGHRSPGSRSFHISRGPAAEKLLLPSSLCVRGTSSFRTSLELDHSRRRPTSDRRGQSSARYAGAAPKMVSTSIGYNIDCRNIHIDTTFSK